VSDDDEDKEPYTSNADDKLAFAVSTTTEKLGPPKGMNELTKIVARRKRFSSKDNRDI